MQPWGRELARNRLCDHTQPRLGRSKMREARLAAQAAGGAREDERAAPQRSEPAGCLAAHKEPRKAADPPEILKRLGAQLLEGDALIVASVEDDEVSRRTPVGGRQCAIEQSGNI